MSDKKGRFFDELLTETEKENDMSENMMEKKKPATLVEMLQSEGMKNQWSLVLPKCLTADRLARVALTQVRKNPKLASCNQGSVLSSLMTCAELGIEPNGRHAHLIPYGQECTLIIDYKGLVELAMRSGKISRIHADIVCKNDTIKIHNGIISHEVNPLDDRGEMVGAYAMCAFVDGTEKHEYMSKREIDAVKDRSRAGKSGPWVTDYNEMSKKTVFRRMSKWLPLSPEIMDSIERDADRIETVSGTASAPVYMEAPQFEAPAADGDVIDAEHTDLNGEPRPGREPASVENMTKIDCLAEIKKHEGASYYAEALSCLPPECQPQQAPVSTLRGMVTELREQAAKA